MSNEWYTPGLYIEAARRVMGTIDLDPASCERANRTVQATRYYTKKENGLIQPWYGNVWLNPPYSETGKWTHRMVEAYTLGKVTQTVVCINASTDTLWFQEIACLFCMVRGRIDFDNPDTPSKRPRFPSIFVYLGTHEYQFVQEFYPFGSIAQVIRSSVPRSFTSDMFLYL